MSEVSKSVTVPTFSGKSEDFELFWPRLEAYANMKGFSESIDPENMDPELPAVHDVFSTDVDVAKVEKAAVQRNKTAVATFTLAFKTVALMNIVNEAKTNEYPKGLAHLIAKELHTQYSPKDRVSKVEATNALRLVKMTASTQPDKFFNKLKAIKVQYAGDITDEMIINEVMVKAPAKYQSVIATECLTRGVNLKLAHLKEAMNTIYRMSANNYTKRNENDSDDEDQGEAIGSAFAGECFECGRKGHRAVDCPSKTGSRKDQKFKKGKFHKKKRGKFSGTCNNCGKQGHMKKDCWELDENKDKRPSGWKSGKKGEAGGSAVDDDELSLFCNECVDEGREISLFCINCHGWESEVKEKEEEKDPKFKVRDMVDVLSQIEVKESPPDVRQAFAYVPVPRESNWYIDTDEEDSEDEEPPRMIKRKRDDMSEDEIPEENRKKPWDVIDIEDFVDEENSGDVIFAHEVSFEEAEVAREEPKEIEIVSIRDSVNGEEEDIMMNLENFAEFSDEDDVVDEASSAYTEGDVEWSSDGEITAETSLSSFSGGEEGDEPGEIHEIIEIEDDDDGDLEVEIPAANTASNAVLQGHTYNDPIDLTVNENEEEEDEDYVFEDEMSDFSFNREEYATDTDDEHPNPRGSHLTEEERNELNRRHGFRVIDVKRERVGFDHNLSMSYYLHEDGRKEYFQEPLYEHTFGRVFDCTQAVVRDPEGASSDDSSSSDNSNNNEFFWYNASRTAGTETGGNTENSEGEGNKEKKQKENKDTEAAGMAIEEYSLRDLTTNDELWVGDSGASRHMAKTGKGLINKRGATASEHFTMGNGASAKASVIGDLLGTVNGQKIKVSEVIYCPDAKFNLFSLTTMMKKGWKLRGNKDEIELIYGHGESKKSIKFDVKVNTTKGVLYCMKINYDREDEVTAVLADELDRKENGEWKQVKSMQQLHCELGHMGENECRKIARHFEMELTKKSMPPCAACAVAKARRKNIKTNKTTVKFNEDDTKEKIMEINERVSLDLSKIKVPTNKEVNDPDIRNPQWRLIVDAATGRKFSEFYVSKDKMVEPTCEQLQTWKNEDRPVRIIRCDNAGENLKLEQRLKSNDWKMGEIKFEYTARATPQQNAKVEKGFETLVNRGRAMLVAANIPENRRYMFAKEAFKTANRLDDLCVVEYKGETKSRVEHWNEKKPRYAKNLIPWGWAGVVKKPVKHQAKLKNKGKIMMMVGYAENHSGDCYRMYDPSTRKVHATRDILWLRKMYHDENGEPMKITEESDVEEVEMFDENEADSKVGGHESNAATSQSAAASSNVGATTRNLSSSRTTTRSITSNNGTVTRSGRVTQAPKVLTYQRLGHSMTEAGAFTADEMNYYEALCIASAFGLEDLEIEESQVGHQAGELVTNCLWEIAGVGAAVGGGFTNTAELKPMKYKEAMKCFDKDLWEEAVKEEHRKFIKYKVFEPVKKEDVPKDAKFISTTWAMKRKSNGVRRARLNMRGFEQEEGVHYDPSSTAAPVTNDVSIRMMFTIALMAGWIGYIIDVKGAFLHGEFENGEQIYTNIPEGFEQFWDPAVYVWLLKKTSYGLIQAAVQFWKNLLKAMQYMGYKRNDADPCLYWNCDDKDSLSVWMSWVDDCCALGPREAVMKSKDKLNKLFDTDDVGEIQEYVGCKLDWDREKRTLKFTQPVLLQSFTDEFDLPIPSYKTPGEPGKVLEACDEGQQISDHEQSKYRSAVGKLLHMMRWSRPEIWNAVRETSRRMSKAAPDHMKAVLRIMKYCVDTKDKGWILKPSRTWDGKDKNFEFVIRGKADSNFATCKETRRSITGYAVWLEDALITVKSGMQKIVAISVTEAEVIALVQCVQELMYMKKLLESMELKVKLPFVVEVDNKGAVDLVNGWSSTGGTKHMEVRIMYLRQLKEQHVLKVIWQPTADNEADIFTKNVDSKTFEKHTKALTE